MAVIQSGATADLLTIDPAAKAARVTLYDAAGAVIGSAANPLRTRLSAGRTLVGQYSVTTFRTVGLATPLHNLFTLSLAGAATVSCAIKALDLLVDETALLATVTPVVALARTTALPTGGTVLALPKYRTSYANAQAVALGATASDGGAATAIVAAFVDRFGAVLRDRQQTAAGFIPHAAVSLLPLNYDPAEEPLILLAGQAIVVSVVQAALVTDHSLVRAVWEEFT